MKAAGYSGTTLAKKLGLKNGFTIKLVNQPDHYFELFTDFPEDIKITAAKSTKKDFIHYFTKSIAALNKDLPQLLKEILPAGAIWISWPKKSSKIETDINENIIRDLALKNGLVDVKVCVIDETWSGLKLVIPVKDRKNY